MTQKTCSVTRVLIFPRGTRPQAGGQSYNLVHVYDDTVVHSVVPVEAPRVMEYIDPETARRRLADAGIAGVSVERRAAPPTRPLPVLR